MVDIYVQDVLNELQEMRKETGSITKDMTLVFAITIIEQSVKMQDEIEALKARHTEAITALKTKEALMVEYRKQIDELKAENERLKSELEEVYGRGMSGIEYFEKELKKQETENAELKERLERAEMSFTLAVGVMRYNFAGHTLIKAGYEEMIDAVSEIDRVGDEEIYEFFEKEAEARLKELKGEKD